MVWHGMGVARGVEHGLDAWALAPAPKHLSMGINQDGRRPLMVEDDTRKRLRRTGDVVDLAWMIRMEK